MIFDKILTLSKQNPINLVRNGEFLLASIEIFSIFIFSFYESPWVILIQFLFMAYVYNLYAPYSSQKEAA